MRYLLFPFGILYDLITSVRNRLYDLGYKPSATFDIPIINVGNLAVGGTGKTPMIEHLIRLLHPKHKIATLSRGYKRKTKGFRILGASDSALTVGDEPFQIYKKYQGVFPVCVGEERAMAVPHILDEHPDTEVILLDDAFQHRRIKPSFQILLTDFSRPFYRDYVLPTGNLREARTGASRADVIIISKCPDHLSDEEMMDIENEVRKYADKPIFFTNIHYGDPVPFNAGDVLNERVVLVSGIAQPRILEQFVSRNFELIKHFTFSDHHFFTKDEIQKVVDAAKQQNAVILTTEKDASRLVDSGLSALVQEIPFFYLPIETQFLKNGEEFDAMILNAVQLHHES